jgi:ferritin-like protein
VSSESLHERFEDLTAQTIEEHRAIVSLMEELEAIDWYGQRIDATPDPELKAVLAHNRNEEIEHAMMNLEWIRRHDAKFDAAARVFLFADGPITEAEERAKAAGGPNATPSGGAPDGSLKIGSLKSI